MARNALLIAILAAGILSSCGGGGNHLPPSTLSSSSEAVQVVVAAPRLGSAANPLAVSASASSPNGISGWVVYVDDQVAHQVDNHQPIVSTSVPLTSGRHTLYVRAWDKVTQEFGTSPTLQVEVNGTQATVAAAQPGGTQTAPPAPAPADPAPAASPAPTPAPAPGPTPAPAPAPKGPLPDVPDDAKVWHNLQNTDDWKSCSDCAGGSPTSNYWTAAFQSSPSRSGSSREFYIGGHAWSNALWYHKVTPGTTWASHFLWDFWVRFDSTSAAHAHSAEYDLWQVIDGREFMIGSQCNFTSGRWDIWDSKNNRWVQTDIHCPRFSPDKWHHIQWYVERWGSHQYHYGILVVDGTAHHLDRTFETYGVDWDDSIGVQFQLDQNASGTRLHEWVDEVKLSVW